MGLFDCALDDEARFTHYVEGRRVARKRHVCCECGLEIPVGEPYAACFGVCDGRWGAYPQHLECYRFCRKLNAEHDACAPFSGMRQCLEDVGEWRGEPGYFWLLEFDAMVKRIAKRLAEGVGPWEYYDEEGNWLPDGLAGDRFARQRQRTA